MALILPSAKTSSKADTEKRKNHKERNCYVPFFQCVLDKGYTLQYDRNFWNTTPNSEDYSYKAAKIKECPGWWNEVRNSYLRIKNHYLQSCDYNHPSFVCYIEAVNEIYNRIGCRK